MGRPSVQAMRGVIVLNPPEGGRRYVTLARAYALVQSREARWNDPVTRDAIFFRTTPAMLAQGEAQRMAREASTVKEWKVKPSGGAWVWQLKRI